MPGALNEKEALPHLLYYFKIINSTLFSFNQSYMDIFEIKYCLNIDVKDYAV